MKKFILPVFVSGLLFSQANAQTKRIAHRSHSGSDRHFSLGGSDNFGNPPEDWKNPKPLPAVDTAKAGTQAGTKKEALPGKKSKKQPKRREKPQPSK